MTGIQSKVLPHVLAGKDVLAQAETGSGKTVAFGLGVLSRIDLDDFTVQGLVLCPTRELAQQVAAEIRRLARLTTNLKVLLLCGGTPMAAQRESLEHGAHIVVGTPGRILDHLDKRTLYLGKTRVLVLDEADRMLDMGFSEDIHAIIKRVPRSRQTLLFSATYPDDIESMSRTVQNLPLQIKTEKAVENKNIEQHFFETQKEERLDVLLSLIATYKPESSIVFCSTKLQCNDVAKHLSRHGLVALAINSDLEQVDRDEVMVRFLNKSASILVATDVAARGVDIKDLSAVINFELSREPEVHVHRIGRTGRAGQKGLALNIFSPSERYRIAAIEAYMNQNFTIKPPMGRSNFKKIDLKPEMTTLKIFGGRKNKLRPGDILGALTQEARIDSRFVGKINIFEVNAYVAIHKKVVESAYSRLASARIKNRNFGMKILQ